MQIPGVFVDIKIFSHPTHDRLEPRLEEVKHTIAEAIAEATQLSPEQIKITYLPPA